MNRLYVHRTLAFREFAAEAGLPVESVDELDPATLVDAAKQFGWEIEFSQPIFEKEPKPGDEFKSFEPSRVKILDARRARKA